MIRIRNVVLFSVVVAAALTSLALAGGRSDSVVKIKSSLAKDAAGKTVVVFTLTMSPTWHLYANPANNPAVDDQKLVVTANVPAKIGYPKGTPYTDKTGEKYLVYEKTIEIRAILEKPVSEASPAEFRFKLQSCNDAGLCLRPAEVKQSVK